MNESTSIAVPSRLAITYRPVGNLVPDPRNARTHPKRQIDQIRASIEPSALPTQFSLTPKAISSRVMAGFRLPG
jgi:hypothetical protein